ncbi:MAG: hypothetical protein GXO10_06370 [Crenarchaeota archaeon]|nr:hypothetical protein [Thermoproteota archaeon]
MIEDTNIRRETELSRVLRAREYVVEGLTLEQLLANFPDKIAKLTRLLKENLNAMPVMLTFIIVREHGKIRVLTIGHESNTDIERKQLIIKSDPDILEKISQHLEELFQEVKQVQSSNMER